MTDPLNTLYNALRVGDPPPFDWIVEYGSNDTIATAWTDASDIHHAYWMLVTLASVYPRGDARLPRAVVALCRGWAVSISRPYATAFVRALRADTGVGTVYEAVGQLRPMEAAARDCWENQTDTFSVFSSAIGVLRASRRPDVLGAPANTASARLHPFFHALNSAYDGLPLRSSLQWRARRDTRVVAEVVPPPTVAEVMAAIARP